jgi:pimeloyl-ACP methyl ester carboxylesterase
MFGPIRLRHERVLPPAIVAQRHELVDEGLGRLSYYSNVAERGALAREPALVLVHDVHLGASSHELRHVFELMRDERAVYALDLPGFGQSELRGSPSAELCVDAIERLLTRAGQETGQATDVVALGLSAELVAQVAARRPELVRSLILLEPTGFTSDWERSTFENAARRGRAVWRMALASRLGLSSLLYRTLTTPLSLRFGRRAGVTLPRQNDEVRYAHAAAGQPSAERAGIAFLAGALFPREKPQAIYTRVHCPTLVLTSQHNARKFGELARFVKWREHFSTQALPELGLATRRGSAAIVAALHDFEMQRAADAHGHAAEPS